MDDEGEDLDDRIAEAVERYRAAHWTALAAKGWLGYQEHGRGAVVMSFASLTRPGVQHMSYLTPTPGMHSGITRPCAQYDPQTSIVLVLVDDEQISKLSTVPTLWLPPPGGSFLSEVLTGTPAPPLAAKGLAN